MCRRSRLPPGFLILAALLSAMPGPVARAQRVGVAPVSSTAPQESTNEQSAAPGVPGQSNPEERADGQIYGRVTDPNGNVLVGASVTLEGGSSKERQSQATDNSGAFTFSNLGGGSYRVTVAAKGFADWASPEIDLSPGRYYQVPEIALRVASANTNVEVTFTTYDLAEEQVKAQERQRILGVLPNFYVSYVWHAAPLTSGQKFRLALRTSIDPVTFAVDAGVAGFEQSQNYFSGYGHGGEGYAKRFGAAYADDVIATFVGSAVFPSLLHQDPRFYYKGTGSVSSRALYAVSTVVMCRGDDGRWEPNYSNILGNLAAAGISNLYYPASNRNGAGTTIENALIGTAEGTISALLQEFLIKKLSRGVPQTPNVQPATAKLN